MKKRELLFFCTATLLFLTSWFVETTFFEMTVSMGEAKKDLKPIEAACYVSLVFIGLYAILYYSYWFFFIGSKKTKIKSIYTYATLILKLHKLIKASIFKPSTLLHIISSTHFPLSTYLR